MDTHKRKHNNTMTVFFAYTLSLSLSVMRTSRLNTIARTHNTTSVHSAVVRHPPRSITCTLSCYICFSVSFVVPPVAFYLSASPSCTTHCNKSFPFCTRTTTWSVSSPSAMPWRVEPHSRCGSGRRRFQRTSWSMS